MNHVTLQAQNSFILTSIQKKENCVFSLPKFNSITMKMIIFFDIASFNLLAKKTS